MKPVKVSAGSGNHVLGTKSKGTGGLLKMGASSGGDPAFYLKKQAAEARTGRKLSTAEFEERFYEPESCSVAYAHGTSVFDPVLCELVYRWFCPPGGSVLDPFAGGSVRGIVASVLGLEYTGIDLSERQIRANRQQAQKICRGKKPRWIVGDSRDTAALMDTGNGCPKVDLVFSCPPYFDLERYSDDPRDVSTMDWDGFSKAYRQIIRASIDYLKPDRFACFVVSDVRDKNGFYRGLPGLTVDAFQAAGAKLYNDAVLVTAVGSLPIRIGKQFAGYRKLGKTHQNVLVFFKGDIAKVKEWPVPQFDFQGAVDAPASLSP